MNNSEEMNELIKRAEEDQNVSQEKETLELDNNQNNTTSNNEFSGYFHERDRLDKNNIVNEVKTSFLEYSMSVIKTSASKNSLVNV